MNIDSDSLLLAVNYECFGLKASPKATEVYLRQLTQAAFFFGTILYFGTNGYYVATALKVRNFRIREKRGDWDVQEGLSLGTGTGRRRPVDGRRSCSSVVQAR
jgi:hypothetical protein